jgi:hypothetical protein
MAHIVDKGPLRFKDHTFFSSGSVAPTAYRKRSEAVFCCLSRSSLRAASGGLLAALGCLPPWVANEKRDFFAESDHPRVLARMKEEKGFREPVAFFARYTLKARSEQRLCTDLLGILALMIIQESES